MTDKKKIDVRHTTYFNAEDLQKLKYIAWHDRNNIKDNLGEAVTDFLKKWEKKNGVITDSQLKGAGLA